jgi:DNA-binding transcriptional regulator YiaG
MEYKSEIYEVVHQDAVEMFKVGAISEARMKEYDKMCLVQEPGTAYEAEKPVQMEHATA